MSETHAVTHERAIELLNAGDARGAVRLLRELLAQTPDDADLLGLLGVALEENGDVAGAIEALRRALPCPADPSIRLRNASNLAALLVGAGYRAEAVEVLQQGWSWPADMAPGAKERSWITLLAQLMVSLEMWEETVALLLPLARAAQHDVAMLACLVPALAALGQAEEALALAEDTHAGAAEEPARQAVLAFLYAKTADIKRAGMARSTFLAGAPPYRAPARPGQRFTIGVVNPPPPYGHLVRPAHVQHFAGNHPSRMAERFADRYRFASILLGAGREAVETFRSYRPQVLINNVVNAEILMSSDTLARTQSLCEAIDAPLINPPEHAARCTRQINAQRLAGVENMVVPKVARFKREPERLDELVKAIEGKFVYPLIMRTTTHQEAANMMLVHTRADLHAALLGLPEPEIYIIEYIGAPRREGHYRRIRAAFVDGEPLIVRADYSREWIVRSRYVNRKNPDADSIVHKLYRERADLLTDANDIIARPQERLGMAAMEALNTVGRLLKLDIFGMDFDFDDNGRIVFFEANASMNFLSTAPRECPYPPEADSALIARAEQLLQRKISAYF